MYIVNRKLKKTRSSYSEDLVLTKTKLLLLILKLLLLILQLLLMILKLLFRRSPRWLDKNRCSCLIFWFLVIFSSVAGPWSVVFPCGPLAAGLPVLVYCSCVVFGSVLGSCLISLYIVWWTVCIGTSQIGPNTW